MKVKFKNGYEADLKDDIAKIYIERGRVEKVNKTGPKPKAEKKEEPKAAE